MKSLLLSSKVPAIPQLHQCSQCNYLPSSVEKLFVQNTDKQQEDLGYYLTIIALYHHIVQLLASICPEHCLSRTLSRRLMLQNGDHHIMTHDYHHIIISSHMIIIISFYLPSSYMIIILSYSICLEIVRPEHCRED